MPVGTVGSVKAVHFEELRRQVMQNSPFYGIYEKDAEKTADFVTNEPAIAKEETSPMTNTNDPMNPVAPQQQAQPVQQYAQQPAFMVYDPNTGAYVSQQIPTMQQPVAVQQPVVMQQPVVQQVQAMPQAQAMPQTQAMPASQAIPA